MADETGRPRSDAVFEQPADVGDAALRVTFAEGNEFQAALRKRVDSYFRQTGRRRRDSPQMYIKAVTIIGVFIASYLLLVFVADAWWEAVPLAVLLGLATAGFGFNLMHDGGHEAFSRFRFLNRLMARSLDVVGGSSYLWHWKHGIVHHTYPNLTGLDTDIELGGLARMTPHQPRQAHHRWQHWYLWVLYGATAIKWHFYDDFRDLLIGRIGPYHVPWPKRMELVILIAGKVVFFTLAFGLPLFFHPLWVVALYYVLVTLVMGVVLSIVFQLAHCVEEAAFPMPAGDPPRLEVPWAVHQVQTTVNFCRDNVVWTWLLGGLNYQIEHHLFPRICHTNYPEISRLVKDTCREFGIGYHEHPSFRAGMGSHYRWLRKMGAPATAD